MGRAVWVSYMRLPTEPSSFAACLRQARLNGRGSICSSPYRVRRRCGGSGPRLPRWAWGRSSRLQRRSRVERQHFDTHVLGEDCYGPLLVEGLQQARDTVRPVVSIHRQFKSTDRGPVGRSLPGGLRPPPIPPHNGRWASSSGRVVWGRAMSHACSWPSDPRAAGTLLKRACSKRMAS